MHPYHVAKYFIPIALSLIAAWNCSKANTIKTTVENLREVAGLQQRGAILGRLGAIEVGEGDFLLGGTVDSIDSSELGELSKQAREMAIRQMTVRRYVITKGIEEKAFEDTEAARYLYPRIERILEEYYYYRKANGARLEAESEKLALGDPEIKAFLARNPTMSSRSLMEGDVKRETRVLIRRIVAERVRQSREAMRKELLENKELEVFK
ncbi:MAG: hypothetical protein K8S54_09100 [Spirochaetia bacterium]|nr:hypothetical protein [Spirochaetia bacterium]